MVHYAVFPCLPIPVDLDTCKLPTLVYILDTIWIRKWMVVSQLNNIDLCQAKSAEKDLHPKTFALIISLNKIRDEPFHGFASLICRHRTSHTFRWILYFGYSRFQRLFHQELDMKLNDEKRKTVTYVSISLLFFPLLLRQNEMIGEKKTLMHSLDS